VRSSEEEHLIVIQKVGISKFLVHPKIRQWCNGSMTVSKTVDKGSNPFWRAKRLKMKKEFDML
jgi:hypothetical protein